MLTEVDCVRALSKEDSVADRAQQGQAQVGGVPSAAYSVVRRRKECAASGQAVAKMSRDHRSDASIGCCIGQAWMAADGFGFPQRCRAAAQTALTGFQSATACIHPGMCAVGTIAFETNASGNRTMKPNEAADSGLFEFMPTMEATQVSEYAKRMTTK